MQCELFFFYQDKDWEKIDNVLKSMSKPFQVITTSELLNKFLHKKGIESKTLRDIFPEEDDLTYEIHLESKKIQAHYRDLFKEIKYRDAEIFSGIENQLLDQIILYEKAKHILKSNINTVFVFEGYSFSYFAIKRLSIEMGFTNNDEIGLIHKNGINIIKPASREKFLLLKNQWYYLKSQYAPPGTISRLYKKILSRDMKSPGSYVINEVFPHVITTTFRILFRPLLRINISKILNGLNTKISYSKSIPVLGFFLTTNIEDLYLKSIYPILDKLKENNQSVLTCVIDIQTKKVLDKKGVKYVNLFEEVNLIANGLRNKNAGKKISNAIKEIAIKNKISIMYYDQLSEYLMSEVYRSMAIIEICNHIFSNIQMKKIIVGTDGSMFGNSVISISKKYNIESYFIPGIVVNKNPLHADWYKADKICLYGKQGYETLRSLGYDEGRLVITGNPKFDFLKKFDTQKSKTQLMEQYHVDRERKLLVIGMARWHDNDEEWMSQLIQFCNKNNFEIVIKIHPMYKSMLKDTSDFKINSIAQKCQNMRYFLTMDMDLYTLVSSADLVITDYSNVGTDAIILGKPLLTVNFVKESFEHEQRYHDYGASLYFEDYQKMERIILEILVEGKHLEELAKGRKIAIDEYNYYNDGNATDRIIDMLKNKNTLTETIET